MSFYDLWSAIMISAIAGFVHVFTALMAAKLLAPYPMGVELVTIGEETGVAVAHIDPHRIASVRAINPALALRRFGTIPR